MWTLPLEYRIFGSKKIRRLFIKLLELFPDNILATKFKYSLVLFQPIQGHHNADMVGSQKSGMLCSVTYGRTTKLCLVPTKQNHYELNLGKLKAQTKIKFSLGIFQDATIADPALLKDDILFEVMIFGGDEEKLINKTGRIPIATKKHSTFFNILGRNWSNFILDIPFDISAARFEVRTTTVTGDFLALRTNSRPNIQKPLKRPLISVSKPVLIKSSLSAKPRKVIFLSNESMTDPSLFWNQEKIDKELPNYSWLKRQSLSFKNSYSTADATIPFVGTMTSCLRSSRHGFGDYSLPSFSYTRDPNFNSLAGYFKGVGFQTIGLTVYPRLSPLYSFDHGFDEYYNAEKPFLGDAPSLDMLINHLGQHAGIDVYYFIHFSHLHLPPLSNDDGHHLSDIPMEALDDILNKGDFKSLYLSQLRKVDSEIGKLTNYLKETDQFDSTVIILSGDHGIKMPPSWGHYSKKGHYLYEERIRVPLLIKPSTWTKDKFQPEEFTKPINAPMKIFEFIEKQFEKDIYPSDCPISDQEKAICAAESIFYPTRQDYSLAIIQDQFKYVASFKFDWKKFEVISIRAESLFERQNGIFNEEKCMKEQSKSQLSKFKAASDEFIKNGRGINQKYIPRSFPNNLNH